MISSIRQVVLIALLISFVPCLCFVLPYLVFWVQEDPLFSLLGTLALSVVMFLIGLPITYAQYLRDTRDK